MNPNPQVKEKTKKDESTAHLFAEGHTACAGCGQALGVRLVLRAAGRNVIATDNTGCLEIFSSNYPYSSWEVPWIHSLFENSAAVASGIEAALRITGKLDKVRVIAQGGDGSTADIGFGALSGMWERGHDILYVCYDNEAYMNTGVQRSGLTPHGADTTTTPAGRISMGKIQNKKDIPALALAHGLPYVATASVAYPHDIDKKVKKALSIRGPKYLQIHVPCPLGWRHDTSLSIILAKAAVETALYPLIEYENGRLVSVKRIARPRPVEEYLKPQRRFAHLFDKKGGAQVIAEIQEIANRNIEKYGLVDKPVAAAAPAQVEPMEAEMAKAEEPKPNPKTFTVAELATFNGKEGRPAYIAHKGKVYDVSNSSLWAGGIHLDGHLTGKDLTSELPDAPHGTEVLDEIPLLGELK